MTEVSCNPVSESSLFWMLIFSWISSYVFFSIAAQPAGVPEILKKSLHSCSVKGEEEVFLIGKNFLKGTKVIFQENVSG